MNSTTVYTEPTNRIKQRILFDDNLSNVVCLCENWAEFVVDFDTLTEFDIQTLDLFVKRENGYIREEV